MATSSAACALERGQLAAAEALTWVGTPGVWQQSCKQAGCDCKGLVKGVAAELGFPEARSLYAEMMAYSPRQPVPSTLLKQGLADVFDPVEFVRANPVLALRAGDVLLGRIELKAAHLGIFDGDRKVIHADPDSKGKVRLTSLAVWLEFYPLDSAWRWRELGGGQ